MDHDDGAEGLRLLVEGKPELVVDAWGLFLSTRIGMPVINEGINALYQGLGSVEDIDKAKRGESLRTANAPAFGSGCVWRAPCMRSFSVGIDDREEYQRCGEYTEKTEADDRCLPRYSGKEQQAHEAAERKLSDVAEEIVSAERGASAFVGIGVGDDRRTQRMLDGGADADIYDITFGDLEEEAK